MAGFNRTYAVMIYVALALVTISQLIFTFLLSFACNPIAKQWDPSIPGSCINTLPTYFALGGTSLAWDVLIIVLPFPILRRLQLTKRNKVSRMASNFRTGKPRTNQTHRWPYAFYTVSASSLPLSKRSASVLSQRWRHTPNPSPSSNGRSWK